MSWFYLCCLSVFCLAVAELTQQHLLNKKNAFTARTSSVLTFLFQSLLTLPILLLTPFGNQFTSIFEPSVFFRVFLATSIGSVALVLYLKSFQVKNISFSTIFVSCSIIVSTTLGILFFHESTNFLKFFGIFLILAAIISLNFKNAQLEKNSLYGLVAGLLFGVCYVLDKSVVVVVPTFIYIFWAFFLVAFFGFIMNPKEVIKSVKGKKVNAYYPIMVSGFGYFLFNMFTFFAYRFGGEVGRIDAINNSQVFLIILFEFFILSHKQSIKRKLITAAVAYSGVALLGFF